MTPSSLIFKELTDNGQVNLCVSIMMEFQGTFISKH